MRRALVETIPALGESCELPKDEAQHLVQVLRLPSGTPIELLDGNGVAAEASLEVRGKNAHAQVIQRTELDPFKRALTPLRLELAVLKGEAMEWVIEKACELGVTELLPLITANTVVQTGRRSPEEFRERWQRIADQALKQCGRRTRLKVLLPTKLQSSGALDPSLKRLWLEENERTRATPLGTALRSLKPTSSDYPGLPPMALLIGPEGGWSLEERDFLGKGLEEGWIHAPVSLGPWILRAETAALTAAGLAAQDHLHRLA